jgi:hypothetical protein
MDAYNAGEQLGRAILPIALLAIGIYVGINQWKKHEKNEKKTKN